MKYARFGLVLALLLISSVIVHGRSDTDRQVPAEPLDHFPNKISSWSGTDRPIDERVREVLGSGDFMEKVFTSPTQYPVDLFIAYFPSQRTGSTIHSPKNCLPGAGWYFESSKQTTLIADDGKPYGVGEYVISDGAAKQFVIYWYQAHGRSVASEYWAKYYLVRDAIALNRTDGALVRVITAVLPNEELAAARSRAITFTAALAPQIHRYIPD